MVDRAKQIGFSQRVRLEWLERTANMILAGNDKDTIEKGLQDLLKDKVSVGGKAVRGNREKIITILMKTWLTTPSELEPMRLQGLELLSRLPFDQHIAVHWGMVMAVYPFWAAVADQTGRLLNLQGAAAASQVQRRVREQFGERETVSRAARRVLRSFLDWGVIRDTKQKGVYEAGPRVDVSNAESTVWLYRAQLHVHPHSAATAHELQTSPGMFAFNLGNVAANKAASLCNALELSSQRLDESVLALKRGGV